MRQGSEERDDSASRARYIQNLSIVATGHGGVLLEIRKRLAEAEPSRADFQMDLAISYVKMSRVDPDGDTWLRRAYPILRTLHARGALEARLVLGLRWLESKLGVSDDDRS